MDIRADRDKLEVELARLSRRELFELSLRELWVLSRYAPSLLIEPIDESRSVPDTDLDSDAVLDAEPKVKARGTVAAADVTRDRGVGVGIKLDEGLRGVNSSVSSSPRDDTACKLGGRVTDA